ncbi:GntR family transcriptional regulator [Candidatus Enterococcus murrayae]|uniref:GntR family transcriptional regulator n=1 Tax=Candidatus Enterococcus murrayae TaxID=2815321 RepID=A0ABS3HJ64_9ENTE|nr:GntR family transcriptional regulator [Enterococcus sp. MJM16]MBO0453511.1 GntR family transcriptional regulator [Enterococcus sp. MJM16]
MGKFLYQEAKEEIIKLIQSGSFKPNEKIMTERELSSLLGFNRMTVKKAIASLVEDGVLFKKRGSGTFLLGDIASNRFEIGDEAPVSLSQGIMVKRMSSSSFVESFKLVYDLPDLMEIFDDYFEFFELIRVREANNEVVSIQRAYFPFRLFKDAHRYDFSQFSLYDYMEYKNKRPTKFSKRFFAKRVENDELLEKLGACSGEYVVCIEYLGYTDQNELVEYTQSFFDPEKVNLAIETKR